MTLNIPGARLSRLNISQERTHMKVAAMIAGLPRFSREFDDQLANLQNAEVDWFFCLWKGKFTGVNDNYVADTWPVDSREKTLEKLQANLPSNHRVTVLELPELPPYPHEGRQLNVTHWTTVPNIWNMWYGLKLVNDMRLAYEAEHGVYDLVIRTRPDITINNPINLQAAKQWLDANPTCLLTPADGRTGMVGYPINDQFAIGLGSTITEYCKCFDHLFEYNDRGVPYHAESLLAYHFLQTGITTPMTDFTQSIRIYKNADGTPDYGHWA